MSDITGMSAGDLARQVARRSLGAREAASAFMDRVDVFNPAINAVVTLAPDVLDQARGIDDRLARGGLPRPLEGVPFVVKDNIDTRGLLTTQGSLARRDCVPTENAVCVQRILDAGGILLGKVNTSEFATDINTSNPLFGTTRNPLDLNVSAGGSSGGTAAAVAADFAPIGLGTDRGGSIRIPSAWCGISGLRPSPGRVPAYPEEFGWDTLVHHVHGPMARSVEDLGLLLSVIAGPDDRDPISLPDTGADYEKAALGRADLRGARIAFCADLGGLVPVDPEIARLAGQAAQSFESFGCVVEEACFDASDIKTIITGTRGYGVIGRYEALLREHGDVLTPQLLGQLEAAFRLDISTVTHAERLRTRYWHGVQRLQRQYDYILTPTVGATPFRLDQAMPSTVAGRAVENYFDVFLPAYAISLIGLPAASVPCGFTPAGGPAGLQIIGRRQRDDQVLNAAAAYMHAHPGHFERRPIRLEDAVPLDDSVVSRGMRF